MEFRILGPLEVRAGGDPVPLPGAKPRAVLAMLLVHANRPVSAERIAQGLWGEEAPAGAANTVQVHVSRLRKALRDSGALVTTPAGYELRLQPGELDAQQLETGLAKGRAELEAGRFEAAAAALERALAEWRGPPLADLADVPFAERERGRLETLRAGGLELLIEARLALGRHAEVVGQLEALIAEHPYRERLRAQYMLALYRCDRQADALMAYQDARRALVDELGIEPGERLRELERSILAQDPALAAPAVATPAPEPPTATAVEAPPARRLVSVVSAAVAGLEPLDAEALHAVQDRFASACGDVVERHGGSLERVDEAAVVGVFGLAELHEDDALRAVRAALELRDAAARIPGGPLAVRLGIESGEVFFGAGRGAFATGDALTRAAGLRAAAPAGETLLGERAHGLVRDAVDAEPMPFDGTAAPEAAWRLRGLRDTGPQRPRRSPFVGRERELAALQAAFARARDERACHLVGVVGPAGIGKSRLRLELADRLDATVLTGGCPSYGEGVAYRPLAEIVGRLGGAERVTALLGEGPAAHTILSAAGLSSAPAQAEETFWAVRRLFEAVAAERPLVVVFEDLHWAEPTLLDLIDYLAVFSGGQAILLVCVARPDLLEARPGWSAPQPRRSLLVLEPLPDAEARRLVAAAGAPAPVAERIVETAEGNPLFLEQLVAVGAGEGELPASIQAVLAARLARLDPGERTLLEHASVQGRTFHATEELVPGLTAARLVALAQRQLIRPQQAELPGHDAFRFAHALIREAAYRNLPRRRRAELHEAVARWLEAQPGTHDEPVGHHLAEVHAARAVLGEAEPELGRAAAERLAAAADAALLRGDPSAGARLLERAASLRPDGELLPALGAALFEAGRVADAARVLEEALATASSPRLHARALVERELLRLETDPDTAEPVPDRHWDALRGDVHGRCRGWLLRGQLDWYAGRAAAADAAWERAGAHAERAGMRRDLFEVIGWRATATALGPAPADAAIRAVEAFREQVRASPSATASALNPLAYLHAMRGDLDGAEALLAEAAAILHDLGGLGAAVSHLEAIVRLLAGRPERAEALLREDVETLTAMSEGAALATTTALLAQAVLAQGRAEEAGELALRADALAAPRDVQTQAIWRGVRARSLALEGRAEEAVTLAREAVGVLEPTDLLSHRGDAMLDLAAVLGTCGRREESERAARAAVAFYERKGNVLAAARVQPLLSDHRQGAA